MDYSKLAKIADAAVQVTVGSHNDPKPLYKQYRDLSYDITNDNKELQNLKRLITEGLIDRIKNSIKGAKNVRVKVDLEGVSPEGVRYPVTITFEKGGSKQKKVVSIEDIIANDYKVKDSKNVKSVKDSKKLTRKDRKHFKVSDSVDADTLIKAWNECWDEDKPEALIELCKNHGISDVEYIPEDKELWIDDADCYEKGDLRYFLIALLPSAKGEFDAISTDEFDNYGDDYRQTVYRADEDCTVADCPSTDPTECPVFKGNVTDVCQKAGIESVFVPKGGYCFIDASLFDTNVESTKEAMINYLKEKFPED